ncbi:MAG: MarR family transcriptional regulator [Rhodobacterales bacterium]|nr:MarR family transcriptional regulator [Rhodobacterales bacterium]MDX5392176.1 MarR family transcriptional regulator [Rhodobacterales bacterium]MDX5491867.1 MarR family transcriptional regulator [Rhodobacterales bacterium]
MAQSPQPDAMLCFNLYAASHAFTRYYKRLLAPLGLTYPQYLVMLRLHDADGQHVGSLARDLCLETNTLSPLLKRIEAMGLVRRARGATDERRVDLFLTDAGRDVAARCAEIPAQIFAELGLDMAEVRQGAAMMRDLRARLAAHDGDPAPGTGRA